LTACQSPPVQRYGSVIGLHEDKLEEYKALHADTWPEVLAVLKEYNIQNYSIYLTKFDNGQYYLFSYLEYTGTDAAADFDKIAQAPITKKWWELTDPMQIPLKSREAGEHWKNMEEVFHME